MRRDLFLLTGAAAVMSGCARSVSNARFADIAKGGAPLRAAFNLEANNVRILMLVSPT
jgi:hypothetical protein